MNLIKHITAFTTSKKGAWSLLAVWILTAVLLGRFAPSAKEYASNNNTSGLPKDAQSMVADEKIQAYFPDDQGLPALLVFHQEKAFDDSDMDQISEASRKIEAARLGSVRETVPFDRLPAKGKESFLSEDQKTLMLPVILKDGIPRDEITDTVAELNELAQNSVKATDLKVNITGPAGISADMTNVFARTDVVLLLSTISLIFLLLIVIYRSPLLALVPLLGAGIVYEVVNKTLGILGANGLEIEKQSLSIMSILLFAALTDYSLFIVHRLKEEMTKENDKFLAMRQCMKGVTEPILFSGGTVLAAVLVLFFAIYEPYRSFAPVFSIAFIFIILGGVTLLPALYSLVGRKAFWPAIPKVGEVKNKKVGFWGRVADLVTKRPVRSGLIVGVILLALALNTLKIDYSFNLIKSFPEDISSRVGYEVLEKSFSPGELAPTTLIMESKESITEEDVTALQKKLLTMEGVESVEPNLDGQRQGSPASWLTEDRRHAKLEITFVGNPYDQKTFDQLNALTESDEELAFASNHPSASFYYAGETAKQSEVRDVNARDTIVILTMITGLIIILLAWQTKSMVAPLYMMATIILSYFTALGTSFLLFENVFDLHEISYRIPIYTFIFLVALGVDYNIMLISRIKEEADRYPIKQAIARGLTKTGGVISSAGLILAATFAVLITQPLMELFMFGFAVSIGVLIDTFLVRTILVPAIMVKLGKSCLWPQKLKE